MLYQVYSPPDGCTDDIYSMRAANWRQTLVYTFLDGFCIPS